MDTFNFGIDTIVNSALQIVIILAVTILAMFLGKWLIPKLITARLPKIRQTSEAT